MKFKLSIFLLSMFLTTPSFASFTCSVSASGVKNCSYVGKINLIYINRTGLVLVYPAEKIDLTAATDIGFSGVKVSSAFAIGKVYDENDELHVAFTKSSMALITSAKVADREVSLAFTDRDEGTSGYKIGSYLKLDRMTLR